MKWVSLDILAQAEAHRRNVYLQNRLGMERKFYMVKGLSILIDILNPQRIVIGSVYARNPDLFEAVSRDVIEREALRPAWDVCEVVSSALGDQVGDATANGHPVIDVNDIHEQKKRPKMHCGSLTIWWMGRTFRTIISHIDLPWNTSSI